MKKDSEINFKSFGSRELSPFMAQQLLYDYATNNLDPSRQAAVAFALQNSPELAKSLDDIIYGMAYCHHLRSTKLAVEYVEKLKTPTSWKNRMKLYRNPRYWNQNTAWILEAIVFSVAVLVVSFVIPWPKYLKLFLEKQNPALFLSEVPLESKTTSTPKDIAKTDVIPTIDYETKAELKTVNADFTLNKLSLSLPRLGASIEQQSYRKSNNGEIGPYLKISIPLNQSEALISELKSQGQLTWITPPAENSQRSMIFGIELWIVRVEPSKGRAPTKDENGE